MFKNYLKTGIRNIVKHKFYSFINISGLTIGITAAIFITIYIADELGYDRFHENINQMYRASLHGKLGGQEIHTVATCPPLAAAMVDEIPEVSAACRLRSRSGLIIRLDENVYTENVFFTDSNFFEFFTFKLIDGDPKTCLVEPQSIVMTTPMAKKYFGDEPAVGKLLSVGDENDTYKVTGVVEEPPSNSHIKFDFLISASTAEDLVNGMWINNYLNTYFTVYPESDLNNVQSKLDSMVIKYVGPVLAQFLGVSLEELLSQEGAYGYGIGAVKDIHLYSTLQHEMEPVGSVKYIYILSAIGIFLVIIACINFMNLSTAKSSGRARAVGMRKAFGSYKSQLISQFLVESTIYSLASVLIAVALVILLMPQFNLISGKNLDISILTNPWMITSLILLVIVVGFIAGSYPAFYLTNFEVAEVVKGQKSRGAKSGIIRSLLVTLQFSISIILIICTLLVYRQLQYTQNRDMGFSRENVMCMGNVQRLQNNRQAFKNALQEESNVIVASFSNNVIPGVNNTTIFRRPEVDEDHIIGVYFGDYEHVEAMGFHIIEGRNFSRDIPSDSSAIIVNEATVKELGWDNPINEELITFNGPEPQTLKVIGVMRDFNFQSIKREITPLILRLTNESYLMAIRYKNMTADEAVKMVEAKYRELAPSEPFDYWFLEQSFDELYRAEQRLGTLFTIFTGLTIFIACLGLFGLAAYTAEQRTKEIGIRKAMGASGFSVVKLLSTEFTKYVAIAFLISLVPSYYFIREWLNGFHYRVSWGAGIFIIGGLLALIIALLTVSYQSIKAARLNPANTLRYE